MGNFLGLTMNRIQGSMLLSIFLLAGLTSCSDHPTRSQDGPGRPATPPARSSAPSDPLDQMVIAFQGGHSRAEIQSRLDKAMQLYGLAITPENYSRAGSALVTLRKEVGPSEMEILSYMIRSHGASRSRRIGLVEPAVCVLRVSSGCESRLGRYRCAE